MLGRIPVGYPFFFRTRLKGAWPGGIDEFGLVVRQLHDLAQLLEQNRPPDDLVVIASRCSCNWMSDTFWKRPLAASAKARSSAETLGSIEKSYPSACHTPTSWSANT